MVFLETETDSDENFFFAWVDLIFLQLLMQDEE